jgi:hypothetical protein
MVQTANLEAQLHDLMLEAIIEIVFSAYCPIIIYCNLFFYYLSRTRLSFNQSKGNTYLWIFVREM